VKPVIAAVLAFIVIAGGLALAVAVLILAFSLLWEHDDRPSPPAREPSTPADGPSCRPGGQDGQP